MPIAPVPADVSAFLAEPNIAVVATLDQKGAPHSVATWYDWEDGRVLLSMDNSRRRLRYLRRDPRVTLTVIDTDDWYRHISLQGEVVEMREDEGLADIDRLARRYTGADYQTRDSPRTTAWVQVARWHGWDASRSKTTEAAWPAS
jgi:PPOX class probable F420-dependent enzyme